MDKNSFLDLLDSKLNFTTADGEFEGIFRFFFLKKQRVVFEHTYYLPSREYIGIRKIPFCDILSFKVIEHSSSILDISKFLPTSKELLNGGLEKSSRIDKSNIVDDTTVNVYECIPEHLRNKCSSDWCVIESTCPTFIRAIEYIADLNTIGVSFHGPDLSRNGKLSWVCISTPKISFLFDVNIMGMAAFDKGLRRIFKDENIAKVIHDCREPANCLKHLFQTELKNVFDTQAADYMINMQMYTGQEMFKYVASLDCCLVKYLKIPQEFLYNRNKCLMMDAEVEFYKLRPISEEFRNVLVKSVIYLPVLKEKQEELLFSPFNEVVDLYLNVFRDATEAEMNMAFDNFTQMAPSYILESLHVKRFQDAPVLQEDIVSTFRQSPHGEAAWRQQTKF